MKNDKANRANVKNATNNKGVNKNKSPKTNKGLECAEEFCPDSNGCK